MYRNDRHFSHIKALQEGSFLICRTAVESIEQTARISFDTRQLFCSAKHPLRPSPRRPSLRRRPPLCPLSPLSGQRKKKNDEGREERYLSLRGLSLGTAWPPHDDDDDDRQGGRGGRRVDLVVRHDSRVRRRRRPPNGGRGGGRCGNMKKGKLAAAATSAAVVVLWLMTAGTASAATTTTKGRTVHSPSSSPPTSVVADDDDGQGECQAGERASERVIHSIFNFSGHFHRSRTFLPNFSLLSFPTFGGPSPSPSYPR